jgi:predicted O-methyltransferase YrrM
MKTFLYLLCILSSIIITNTKEVCNSNNTDQDSCLTKEEGFIHDWFSKNIPNWKKHLAQFANKENLNFLEIGTYEGKSALWLLENVLTHPTSRLTCIDPWVDYENDKGDNIFTRFSHNIKNHVEKTIIVRDYSSNALRKYEPVPTFDLIYVDGCHTALCAIEDMILSFPLLKPGGVFIFDDYGWRPHLAEHERPKLAADSFMKIFSTKINVLHKGYQVFIKKNDE